MPPQGAPFRALHPYQFAPPEYNPLMPSPDHPPNAPHPPPRSDHSVASDNRDRNHSPYYSHPPPPPSNLHASSSRNQHSQYQTPPSPQFRTHAVNWGLPPLPSGQQLPPPSSLAGPSVSSSTYPPPAPRTMPRTGDEAQRAPQAALLYAQSQQLPPIQSSTIPAPPRSRSSSLLAASTYQQSSSSNVPRLPPIMQVEKQQVTTSATQAASASRRRNEANFVCPVPGCGSTFTRRFNLRGHLRSHTAERPFLCEWPGCNKGFARQHDCKRHQALHTSRSQSNVCQGCGKTFSRLDALNRHLRSDGGAECRQVTEAANIAHRASPPENQEDWENGSNSTERSTERGSRRTPSRANS
ncbi:hypothetical protein PYCCODRAFT_1422403 [Trametes coccinea BRFM310]|uniref:C2H2-type domain-containing protein n=1 Tax=Trametes coccinea (strain BRFM310) TaxID=1353009 RepID=A0A1Y2J3T2_TRAC3|nr:hypothetical protein PYCCODRAFT_1422403 [Trametes coccinea BRFM310]